MNFFTKECFHYQVQAKSLIPLNFSIKTRLFASSTTQKASSTRQKAWTTTLFAWSTTQKASSMRQKAWLMRLFASSMRLIGWWMRVLEIIWFLIIYLVFENYLFSKTNLPFFGCIVAIKLRVYISWQKP